MTDEYSALRAASANSTTDSKVHKPSSGMSPITATGLNARSCVTCRRRKVKCDKKHPCSNCAKARIQCIFPSPGRAPRKPKKPADTDLADRLRRLEGLFESLGGNPQAINEPSPSPSPSSVADKTDKQTDKTPSPAAPPAPQTEETADQKFAKVSEEFFRLAHQQWERYHKDELKKGPKKPPKSPDGLSDRFGKLVVSEGRSRYIGPGIWSKLQTEAEEDDDDLSSSVEDDEDHSSPMTVTSASTSQGFVFGLSSSATVEMTLLHPPAEHVPIYWSLFKENVDPVIKMSHIPTREPEILQNAAFLGSLSRPSECVMFSIYYAAITSTPPEECKYRFGESKVDLLARFRFGMEQALARADFLRTDSIVVLQSFIIFLVCLRRHEDARTIWSLSSLALRIAQGLGLHRDGSNYPNVTPFKQEMRRRIWWQTVILDSRASEEIGCDSTLQDMMADTKLPRNLNDDDMTFDMKELPESKVGFTDMTFDLVRFEINTLLRRISFVPPHFHRKMPHPFRRGPHFPHERGPPFPHEGGPHEKHGKDGQNGPDWSKMPPFPPPFPPFGPHHDHPHGPPHGPPPHKHMMKFFGGLGPGGRGNHLEAKKAMVEDLKSRIEEQYLKDVDESIPIQWLTATVARLTLNKITLMMYHPYQRLDGGASLPQDVKDELFKSAINTVELALSYQRHDREKYDWLLKTYPQWHAIAFILSELCVRTTGPDVERAWRTIELATSEQSDKFMKLAAHLWKPLRKLLARAKHHREQSIAGAATAPKAENVPSEPQPLVNMDIGANSLYPAAQVPGFAPSVATQDQLSGVWPSIEPVRIAPGPNAPAAIPPAHYAMIGNSQILSPGTVTNLDAQFGLDDWNNVNMVGVNSTTAMGDDSLNWATWDDMVQDFGIQNSGPANGQTSEIVPSFFGSGTNWY